MSSSRKSSNQDGPKPNSTNTHASTFRNGRDYPTPTSYRHAAADIAGCSPWPDEHEEASYNDPFAWLRLFRQGGSKVLPPRREGLLQRGHGGAWRLGMRIMPGPATPKNIDQ